MKDFGIWLSLFVFSSLFVPVSAVRGQCLNDELRITASDRRAGDEFGAAVQFVDNKLVIGAPFADGAAPQSGAIYVFQNTGSTWSQVAKLWPDDGMTGDEFGRTLASDDNALVVGAPYAEGATMRSGAAYLFSERPQGVWLQDARLHPPSGGVDDLFAHALSIAQNWLIVGAPGNDANGNDAGTAFVFSKSTGTWQFHQELTSPDIAPGDQFGFSVGVEDQQILVGAPQQGVLKVASGHVHAFAETAGNWLFGSTLQAFPDQFELGYAIAIEGSSAIIGHPGTNTDRGGVTRIRNVSPGTWARSGELNFLGASLGDRSGSALSMNSSIRVVGSPRDDRAFIRDAGSVSVFCPDGCSWGDQERLMPRSGFSNEAAGTSVDCFGSLILVGSPHDDETGSAFLFFEGPEGFPYGFPTAGTGGFEPQISISGCNGFGAHVEASEALGGARGTLLIGFAPGQDSSGGWTRWVDLLGSPPGLVIPIQFFGEGPGQGTAHFLLDTPRNPLIHGLDVYFQFTVMDPGAVNGVAATRGILTYFLAPF